MRQLFLAVFMICALVFSVANVFSEEAAKSSNDSAIYKYQQAQDLISLVKSAASEIKSKGESVFPEFKEKNSKWRHDNTYIFIIDADGNMILHPDPALEGKNQTALKDVNNKLIIKGFMDAVSGGRDEGWFHYQWPEPGSMFPLWKSSFVQLVTAPSGKKYVVGSGLYNMKMEKGFIIALVNSAAALIEREGPVAFPKFRDKAGQFIFMDTYVFVDRPDGVEVVNGAFPNIEGRNLMDYKDSEGKYLVRDYIDVALTKGSGWVDYLWPKPHEATPSKKNAYVKKAKYGNQIFIVGSGAYLD